MAEYKIEAELEIKFKCISLQLSENEAGALMLAIRNIQAPDIKRIYSILSDAVGDAKQVQKLNNNLDINHLGDQLLGICSCESCLNREMDNL